MSNVASIGAGPVGLFLAIRLDKTKKITIFESRDYTRKQVLLIQPPIFKEFDNIPRLKRRISRENFVKTFSTIYFGSEED